MSFWQGLDGEATEPMIKELDEDREETQDPEVEFAIAGAVRECGGLEILLGMIQVRLVGCHNIVFLFSFFPSLIHFFLLYHGLSIKFNMIIFFLVLT